jgi:predicted DNA-binding transcriptional regulator AlpA
MQRIIRLSELASRPGKPGLISASPASIWRWIRAGKFPAPFTIGERTTVWDLAEVEIFLNKQRSKVPG